MTDTLKLVVEIDNLSNEEARDIAITFFEGAMYGWWAQQSEYDPTEWGESTIPDGFVFFTIRPEDPELGKIDMNAKPTEVTPELIRLGMARMFADHHHESLTLGNMSREDWTGHIDDIIADDIMQYAIYGDILYA